MIYLKNFMVELAEKKELELLNRTKDQIRDIERKMEDNRKEIDAKSVVNDLQKIQELHKKLSGDDWRAIEKEVGRMN